MACGGAIILSSHPHARANTIILLLLTISIHLNTCLGQFEADTLIQFKGSLGNNGALSTWKREIPPCNGMIENWVGLLCEDGTVWGLMLDNMGLTGTIHVDILTQMPKLRIVSFVNNSLEGPLPDFSKLHSLKSIFLSNNKFSGEIPHDMFKEMMALKKVHLDNNRLSGPIPMSLPTLPRLMELLLQNNEFSGFIPPFPPHKITVLDLSNNKLEGDIPRGLSNFPASAFAGNKDLCGTPLRSCSAPNELSVGTIITVVILLVVTGSALVTVVVILLRRKGPPAGQHEAAKAASAPGQVQQRNVDFDKVEKGQAAEAAAPPPASSPPEKHKSSQAKKQEANMKITFLQEDCIKFDMSNLLKASAEVLGSGVIGSTYKADLGNGRTVVVKRFKHMNNVNKQDFCEHMRRLGRLDHPNLLTVLGYYYRKEEKLFVTSYVENVSLAAHLHGNTVSRSPLDWPTRLCIMKGVAKGLLHLYNELPSVTAPHGHLKSSNVLLDAANNPLLNDYCLLPIVNQEDAQHFMIAYKSPEFESGRITKKTDVWSLGILILEILTGKFPPNFLQQGKASSSEPDVAAWVDSVVGTEPFSPDVFDKTINKATRCDTEMIKLLKIGLSCCQVDPEKRPDIKEAMEMIQEIKEEES